jgi:UDP-N-acetyl-D-glucosamine dehydrogenase
MCAEKAADKRRVLIIGQGYVGLPLAMRAVDVGHDVVAFDIDNARVKRLQAGDSFVEDVPSDVLAAALESGRYRVSDEARSCAGFDVAVIAVPTPLREGTPDLSYIEASAATVARYTRPGTTVILESTTYPGTTEEIVAPAIAGVSGLIPGIDFFLGYSPERIDPGNPVWNVVNTPKLVAGINAASLAAVKGFYDTIVERTIAVSGTREAELAKLVENTFRHVNIALVNELAMFAADLGIDVWEAIDAASSKPFGFMRFLPGAGVGGHCLPIDPSFLSWRVKRVTGRSFRFVELANDVNDQMPDYVVHRLLAALNEKGKAVRGSRILLLGLTYKRNTRDARESPSLRIADLLLTMGAEVRAADPGVLLEQVDARIVLVEATAEECGRADAVVVLADHDSFDLNVVVTNARYVLDTRNRLGVAPNVEKL